MSVTLHHAPPGFPRVFDVWEIFSTLVWRNVTARGPLRGGGYNNSFDMNGGILVGGFINYILRLREKTPRGFIIRKRNQRRYPTIIMYNLNYSGA